MVAASGRSKPGSCPGTTNGPLPSMPASNIGVRSGKAASSRNFHDPTRECAFAPSRGMGECPVLFFRRAFPRAASGYKARAPACWGVAKW